MCQHSSSNILLKIKAFYLRLLCLPNSINPFPNSLTLHYLPRINSSPLEIDQVNIPPHASGFVTLHRLVSGSFFYGSRQRVGVSEGVKFEVYLGEEKMVRGFFRRDEEGEWKLELKCGLQGGVMEEIKQVQVIVAADGGVEMSEKVEMVVKRMRRERCFQGLEEIPEVREMVEEDGSCCCCDSSVGDGEVEAEMEGVSWALDVGIWVACLGFGYLLSVASYKRLRNTLILMK